MMCGRELTGLRYVRSDAGITTELADVQLARADEAIEQNEFAHHFPFFFGLHGYSVLDWMELPPQLPAWNLATVCQARPSSRTSQCTCMLANGHMGGVAPRCRERFMCPVRAATHGIFDSRCAFNTGRCGSCLGCACHVMRACAHGTQSKRSRGGGAALGVRPTLLNCMLAAPLSELWHQCLCEALVEAETRAS